MFASVQASLRRRPHRSKERLTSEPRRHSPSMASRSWTEPPTRRELTLVLFAFSVFVISFNLHTSLRTAGVEVPSYGLTRKLGLSTKHASIDDRLGLDPDGRRPLPWRDPLENQIFGSWLWREGHVADGIGVLPEGEGDQYLNGSIWAGSTPELDAAAQGWATAKAGETLMHWGEHPPISKVLQHTAGYTIFENVIQCEGTIFIIAEDSSTIPQLKNIGSSQNDPALEPEGRDWQILTREWAVDRFGPVGGIIPGVTWFASGPSNYQDPHTLFSLWRLYSSMDVHISEAGNTTLRPPTRIFFPGISRYTPTGDEHKDPWNLTEYGFAPRLAKAAFPTMDFMHFEEWDDFLGIPQPFLIERLVVADRGAALRALLPEDGVPEWAGPYLNLPSSPHWWAPIRNTVVGHLGVREDAEKEEGWWGRKQDRPVVVYMSGQLENGGAKIRPADHAALAEELEKMGKGNGYEVIILTSDTPWDESMRAVVRATIVLGVHGDGLSDGIFARPSARTTIIEFFPAHIFTRETEIPIRAAGLNYVAFWNERKFTQDRLPNVAYPEDDAHEVAVDARAVTSTIQDILS